MMLSKYFSLEEAISSQEAARSGIMNVPSGAVLEQMKRTATKLDAVRELLGTPILVSSFFRCLALNRRLKSKDTSQHVKGEAVDMKSPKFGTPKQIIDAIIASGIVFDQLILEFNSWVHISFVDSGNRGQVLVIDNNGTRKYIP